MEHAQLQQPSSSAPQTAPEVRCGYMGRSCDRPRSLKRDGRLHRFCMYHRERANLNQRRVDARKRLKGHDQEDELSAKEYEEVKRREAELEWQLETGGCWLSDQELGFLSYLLFHDDESSERGSPLHGSHDTNHMW